MSDLHELSAAAQLRALGAGEVSSRDLTAHYLDRIDRLDGELGAFLTVTAELALTEADRADARLAAGERAPLLGLPIAFKDYPTAGVRTTLGSAALASFVPSEDGWTIGLLRQAGAVTLGKTNTAEFGATCFTENDHTGRRAVTPYDPTRYSSGSSGGSATAVAAGLAPLAHAADGAGSTRTPAATCHLVGVKPSRGLVSPSAPSTSLAPTTIEGPITRTVADAALLLDVMAQPWRGDPTGWRPTGSFAETIGRKPGRPLRVAMWTRTGLDDVHPHPEAVRAVERAADALREAGHEVREVALPAPYAEPVRQALGTWFAAMVHASVAPLVPVERHDLLLPYTRLLYETGATLSSTATLMAQAVLARFADAFLAALDDFDLSLTPTTSGPPAPIGHFLTDGAEGVADAMLAWSCYTPWANLTGQPAISLPSHLDADGLPYAVQLVGRARHDGELLAVAAHLERAGLWSDVHPHCWDE
ncbi:MAG TPA: amidase [Mycobacteriales bacterium]|nr:amidase [Mycobacteriales bacterium]